MNNSGTILEDEKGKRYFLPNSTDTVMPKRIILQAVDEAGNPKLDGQQRPIVKIFSGMELLQAIREKRMKIVGFVD